MNPKRSRAAWRVVAVVIAAFVVTPMAHASSIAYIRSGAVWLASPDGATQVQVTPGTGWDLPSQANDGTLLALRGGYFHHLDRHGQDLSPPVPTVFTPAPPGGGLIGPITAAISPDGLHQAYFGEGQTGAFYPPCQCTLTSTHTFVLWGRPAASPSRTRRSASGITGFPRGSTTTC
ncbi:MAG: hypothetical protein ACYDHH_16155 [Solirubrobacteraceae bacterium]